MCRKQVTQQTIQDQLTSLACEQTVSDSKISTFFGTEFPVKEEKIISTFEEERSYFSPIMKW